MKPYNPGRVNNAEVGQGVVLYAVYYAPLIMCDMRLSPIMTDEACSVKDQGRNAMNGLSADGRCGSNNDARSAHDLTQ